MVHRLGRPRSKHYRLMIIYSLAFLVMSVFYFSTRQITKSELRFENLNGQQDKLGRNGDDEDPSNYFIPKPIEEKPQGKVPKPPVNPPKNNLEQNQDEEQKDPSELPSNPDPSPELIDKEDENKVDYYAHSLPKSEPMKLKRSDVIKLVSVGIKTFNRPSCALNLIRSILYYFPGISIIIVNDGVDPIPISGGLWSLKRPSADGSKETSPFQTSTKVMVVNSTVTINDPLSFSYSQQAERFKDPELPDTKYPVSLIRQIMIPFDSGVSLGRNVLVQACAKKYILMTDDDYEFTEETDVILMTRILEQSEVSSDEVPAKKILKHNTGTIDIVGGIRSEGKMSRLNDFPRGSNFDIFEEHLDHLPKNYLAQGEHYLRTKNTEGQLQDRLRVLKIIPSRDDATPDTFHESEDQIQEPLANLMVIGNCLPLDFIQQFFMVRVDKLRYTDDNTASTLWDPTLKNNDHYDFFLRASGKLQMDPKKPHKALNIIACTNVRYMHAKTASNVCSAESLSVPPPSASNSNSGPQQTISYKDFRARWIRYIPYLFKKWNVGLVADEELNKLVMIVRDKLDQEQCKILQVRRGYTVSETFDLSCTQSIDGLKVETGVIVAGPKEEEEEKV